MQNSQTTVTIYHSHPGNNSWNSDTVMSSNNSLSEKLQMRGYRVIPHVMVSQYIPTTSYRRYKISCLALPLLEIWAGCSYYSTGFILITLVVNFLSLKERKLWKIYTCNQVYRAFSKSLCDFTSQHINDLEVYNFVLSRG